MSDLEAIGDAATGAVLAGALERGIAADDGHTHEMTCLNCGTALTGDYCHACGQKAHVHRSLAAFFHDLLHGAFHFEGKIWRTLPMLAWRPGELTRSYIDGKRMSYVSPIALFLFCVFLMFAVASLTGLGEIPTQVKTDVAEQIREREATLKQQETDRSERLKAEGTAAGKSIGADRIAAERSGRPILYCSPKARAQLGAMELIDGLEAIPAAERQSMTLKQAMLRILQKKYPCR